MKRALIGLAASLSLLGPAAIAPARAQEQVLNVQDADIRAFIQDVARTTGFTFIVDPRVRGTVSVTSNGALSRAELFEVFLSTLRANGLTAIPTARGAYRIAPAEGVAQQPSGPGAVRVSTEIIRLKSIEAAAAAALVKPLVGPQGQVIASAQGNTLIVADYADNLVRIRAVLAQMDQDRSSVETVTLRYSSAREIAAVLNELMAAPGERSAARNGLVSVLPVDSSNSVILRGEPDAVRRLLPIISDLDHRAEARGGVQVIRLQNADAAQILPVLQQIVGQAVTPAAPTARNAARNSLTGAAGGAAAVRTSLAAPATETAAPAASSLQPVGTETRIARYPGANALVISAPPEMQRTLADVIRQLDVRREQVLVEAIVVELSDSAARKLGVQLAIGGGEGEVPFALTNYSDSAPNSVVLAGAAGGSSLLPTSTVDSLRTQALSSLAGATGITTGLGGPLGKNGLFGAVLNAVQQDVTSNLLSTPSVLTLDNQDARILVGQQIPITTGEVLGDSNVNAFRTVTRQDVGIQLEVRPQINAGGAITLYLRQEVSSVAGPVSTGSDELITNAREIETTVLVDNGDIVVLGGLLGKDERLAVEKVPGLGDIPGLGALFRSRTRENTRTNLMVFIRPTIIRSPGEAQAATAPRYDYIRNAQAQASRDGTSSLEDMLRDYMRTQPPASPEQAAPAAP